eukprot:scaffold8212_cov81-Skeletonema_dohrnii-CCMP3373.AAC.3
MHLYDVNPEKYYSMCEVHFFRSECRVRKNNSVVPLQRKDEFKDQVRALQAEKDADIFWERVDKLKSDFPKCQNWLNWYINPQRAMCFFPSLNNDAFVGNVHDTNAQESTGRTIQLSFPFDKTKANLFEVFMHLYRYGKICRYMCFGLLMAMRHQKMSISSKVHKYRRPTIHPHHAFLRSAVNMPSLRPINI